MIFKHFFFLCDLGKHFDQQITVSVLPTTPLIMKSPPKLCNSKNPRGPLLGYNSPPRYLLILLLYVSYWLTRETTCGFVEATRGIDKDKVWSCHLSTRQELLLQDRQRQKQLKEIIYPLWLLCFFLTTSQRKIAPPPQTNRCTSCVLFPNWASGYFHPRFAAFVIPLPRPPPKKNYLSANAVLTQLVRCYFFVPPKEKGKKQRKNKRVKVLNEACTYIWVQSFRSGWMVG